ncbi:hypothetical protein QYE76_032585 [Lolium multiflorum]|uniref:Uncharacterized protein n=1 Tax=Lolium multiflorum TaxID=4521 RepID=A0AAD8VIG8_LOLMU|nr:hypothetical protein QYE76_032585 [Lolium multiflorum]
MAGSAAGRERLGRASEAARGERAKQRVAAGERAEQRATGPGERRAVGGQQAAEPGLELGRPGSAAGGRPEVPRGPAVQRAGAGSAGVGRAEGLARVCGQNIAALQGTRFTHFARHDTVGEPMALSSHPVLKHHVEHLDFMLHETRKDLEQTRVHAHRAQMALAHHADAIRLLAKDRRTLRLQRAKKDATIARLREKIRTLEATVRSQQDQIQEMEENGEDIQGGEDFLSDDNDYEEDEFTDEEDYEFPESGEDGIIPIDVDEDDEE